MPQTVVGVSAIPCLRGVRRPKEKEGERKAGRLAARGSGTDYSSCCIVQASVFWEEERQWVTNKRTF